MLSALKDTDFIDIVNKDSLEIIKKNREENTQIFNAITEYCEKKKLIFSDIEVLIDQPDEKYKKKQYNIYCDNTYNNAVALADIIFEKIGIMVKMKTQMAHKEFVIEYDTKQVIRVFGIEKSRDMDLHKLILPVKIDKLYYLSPEVEIIDVYNKLYMINNVDNWGEALGHEEKLYELIKKRSDTNIFGGDQHRIKQEKLDIQYIKFLVLSDFCGTYIKDYVVIGAWSMFTLNGCNNKNKDCLFPESSEKLQMITATPIERSIEDIKFFLKKITNANISSRKQELFLPKDFRTLRYTIYIRDHDGTDRPLIDIFNSGLFELIPFIPISISLNYAKREKKTNKIVNIPKHITIKIGNAFVILRFLMIDLWIIKMIFNMGKITKEIKDIKIKNIINVADKIKENKSFMSKVFGVDYVGTYRDFDVEKKVAILQGKRFMPYTPESFKKRFDKK